MLLSADAAFLDDEDGEEDEDGGCCNFDLTAAICSGVFSLRPRIRSSSAAARKRDSSSCEWNII